MNLDWASPELKTRIMSNPVMALAERGINIGIDLPQPIVEEFLRVAHLLWVDGKITPIDKFYIDPGDEGLLFGRGVWESTRTVNGKPWLWALHLDRIVKSAQALRIGYNSAHLPSADVVTEFVKHCTTQDVLVRLNISAGRVGKPGMIWMSLAPQMLPSRGLKLKSIKNPVEKGQLYLTLKTFQYATRLKLGQEVAQTGFDTALILDENQNVMEASHANIFFKFPEGWVTPQADGGFLPGTVRQVLLGQTQIPIKERIVAYAELNTALEVFVTNSNVGIVPVVGIDNLTFGIGTETQQLMQWMQPPSTGVPQYRLKETAQAAR